MRVDFSNWTQRTLSVEHLKLDVSNPRFSYFSEKKMNQTEIVKFLIERFKVYELAKDIAADGYWINEEPIVCKEGDNYVVLEGNRRVAACKILLNPYKYLSNQRAQNILKYNYSKDKLLCHIAPTRKSADVLIYRRHTTTPVERWETVSQDAHLFKLYDEDKYSIEEIASLLSQSTTNVRKALRRYHIHQYAMTLFEDNPTLRDAVSSDTFPITNVERFYDYKDGLDFLGISFTLNGEINKRLDTEELNKRFRFIVEEVLNDNLNSRVFNREKDKEYYMNDLNLLTDKFDFTKVLNEPTSLDSSVQNGDDNDEKEESPTKETKQSNSKKNNYKLLADKSWQTGIVRIDNILKTIKTLKYDKHIDVIAIAFRCYLDMVIYEFLEKQDCLKDAVNQENNKVNRDNDKLYAKIKQYLVEEFALSETEIKDEFKYLIKLGPKNDTSKSLSLGECYNI